MLKPLVAATLEAARIPYFGGLTERREVVFAFVKCDCGNRMYYDCPDAKRPHKLRPTACAKCKVPLPSMKGA